MDNELLVIFDQKEVTPSVGYPRFRFQDKNRSLTRFGRA
jgi:hypothetical protein